MFWLIETKEQLDDFSSRQYEQAFIEIIPYSNIEHPTQNKICGVYVKPLDSSKGFVIAVDHSETLSLDINEVTHVLNNIKTKYVRDKKEFLHYLIMQGLYDITLSSPPYIPSPTPTHTFFYSRNETKTDINRIIPIVKHYEYCEKIFNDLKDRTNESVNEFYNNKATVVFNAIERSGLRIDQGRFKESFYDASSDFVYTQYNFKTLTTRPSNKFKGVNYAALPKENKVRNCFIPRNDILVELDISAYHPTLLANLVGYEFKNKDIHEELANMYQVDYQKSKELTFKQLYGGIFEQYKNLEFFNKVQVYTDDLWDNFQYVGEVKCPISGYMFYKNKLENMNPQKLLNYLLQNLETSNNVNILWEIFKLLKGKNTKLVLYTYDAFLFDLDKQEKDTFNAILKVFETNNLQIKMSYGNTYDFTKES